MRKKAEHTYKIDFDYLDSGDYGYEMVVATSAQEAVDIFRDYYAEYHLNITKVYRICENWK